MNRFHKTEENTYKKYVTCNGVCYSIEISATIWNTVSHKRIADHIQYWKKKSGIQMKYGSVSVVDKIPTCITNVCKLCNKTYKTRTGLLKHIKKYHNPPDPQNNPPEEPQDKPQDKSPEEPSEEQPEEPINERTIAPITNIANQTNNIQVNLPPLRNFSEENHKWLTHDVIINAISDIPTAIPYLIKEKHFNDRFPENQNVRLDNKRSLRKRLKVYDGGIWRLKERPDVEFRLIKQMYEVLFDFVEMMTDEEEDELDDDATPIDRRIANITRRIRTSEMRRARVRNSLRGWDEFKDSIEGEYEKTIEPFKDKLDTYLLDVDLRLEQLRERRAMLMS
jgi:hypothetical protein